MLSITGLCVRLGLGWNTKTSANISMRESDTERKIIQREKIKQKIQKQSPQPAVLDVISRKNWLCNSKVRDRTFNNGRL